jgi:hypothetical protein
MTDSKDDREVETAYKKGHGLIRRGNRRAGLSYPWHAEIMGGFLVKVNAKLSHYRRHEEQKMCALWTYFLTGPLTCLPPGRVSLFERWKAVWSLTGLSMVSSSYHTRCRTDFQHFTSKCLCFRLRREDGIFFETCNTGSSKKMDGIWNSYNLKSTRRICKYGILKCSEKFKVLDLCKLLCKTEFLPISVALWLTF